MDQETVVAAFDTKDHAMAALNALKAGGFHPSDISVFDSPRLAGAAADAASGKRHAGFWQGIFGGDVHRHEAEVFSQVVVDGGTVISVRVPESEVAQATGILDSHSPINVHDRAITTGVAPAAHVETVAKTVAAASLPVVAQTVAVSPKLAAANNDVLRLAEEQLEVGKKMIETGRTRVRRFTTETDASKDISLHEEHAEVLRKALSKPTPIEDIDWADGEIEVRETAEQALVKKTARIVEEVQLRTHGTDHVETIHEKLRRQQAEVLQVDAKGNQVKKA